MKYELPSIRNPLKIGTRGSPLALVQAKKVLFRLSSEFQLPEAAFKIIKITTRGDLIADRSLSELGGKGLFTKEIEDDLLNGKIDVAVHSMKDMPSKQPKGLIIDSYLPRQDTRDAFLSYKYSSIKNIDTGIKVGTSSVRRRAQILNLRPDLKVVNFRGNVQTRVDKLKKSSVSATFLAMAGLNRLKVVDVPIFPIDIEEMLPAVAQGVIGVERRVEDNNVAYLLHRINDPNTEECMRCERAYLKKLDGSCQSPIAGIATLEDGNINFKAEILRLDGIKKFTAQGSALIQDSEQLGLDIALKLKEKIKSGFSF